MEARKLEENEKQMRTRYTVLFIESAQIAGCVPINNYKMRPSVMADYFANMKDHVNAKKEKLKNEIKNGIIRHSPTPLADVYWQWPQGWWKNTYDNNFELDIDRAYRLHERARDFFFTISRHANVPVLIEFTPLSENAIQIIAYKELGSEKLVNFAAPIQCDISDVVGFPFDRLLPAASVLPVSIFKNNEDEEEEEKRISYGRRP